MTRPPTLELLDAEICAPSCTTTSPYLPPGASDATGVCAGVPLVPDASGSAEKRNCSSGLLNKPRAMSPSLIGSDDATRPWRLICDEPPKRIPFGLMMYTWPGASIFPRICDGEPLGSAILLKAIHCD